MKPTIEELQALPIVKTASSPMLDGRTYSNRIRYRAADETYWLESDIDGRHDAIFQMRPIKQEGGEIVDWNEVLP